MTAVSGAPRGLTDTEAARRLHELGPNELPPPEAPGLVRQVLEQLRDPMLVVLMLAAVLTTLTGDRPDTVVIVLVIVLNTTVSLVQHRRAEQAVAALHDLAPLRATVVRDDVARVIASAEVVPGDLVLLGGGDIVPADGSLALAEALTLDESAMTGESVPVLHAAGDEVRSGTLVVRGRGRLVVTATGAEAGLGQLAQLVQDTTARRTPLQDRMRRLSAALVIGVVALTVLVVGLGLLRGEPLVEMLVVGASLAVAAVPESLPAVMTVALATGAHRMARRSAVVRRLSAVETLGSVTVIATDKTGTLTHGSLAVEHVWAGPDGAAGHGVRHEHLLRDLVLCNDATLTPGAGQRADGDPLEVALLVRAEDEGVDVDDTRELWPRTFEQPFDAATQSMTTGHVREGRPLTVVKGSPERVLSRLPDTERRTAEAVAEQWADEGCRVMAVAEGAHDGAGAEPLRFAGLVAFSDPPREAAAGVVARCTEAGIRVVLVTGDHPLTARSVARRVGIEPEAVYARVAPDGKLDLIGRLQSDGEVVAMLGDGVNDAPALKKSDIGVAAGRGGTEVARQAADVVLLDDDLSTVVAAVEEGRRIFANLRTFLVYAVSGGLSEVAVMLFGPFAGLALPLLPSQILWINLLTHGLTGVAFSGEAADPHVMREPPIARTAPILTHRHAALLAAAAAVLAVSSLAAALLVADDAARTVCFLTLGLGQLGVALALRTRWSLKERSDWGLPAAVLGSIVLMLLPLAIGPLGDLLGVQSLSGDQLGLALLCATVPALAVGVLRRVMPATPAVRPGPSSRATTTDDPSQERRAEAR